jgi:6-phosphogluconate dehydrogenase
MMAGLRCGFSASSSSTTLLGHCGSCGSRSLPAVSVKWNNGELNGYLMEITSHIFGKVDEQTGLRLIDEILDVAKQKGADMWAPDGRSWEHHDNQ